MVTAKMEVRSKRQMMRAVVFPNYTLLASLSWNLYLVISITCASDGRILVKMTNGESLNQNDQLCEQQVYEIPNG